MAQRTALDIAPAQESDVPAIFALIRELAAFESATFAATEEALRRDGFGRERRYRVLLARWEGQIVGFALYVFTYSTYRSAPVLFLEDLYVRPELRGRGIGLQLMKALAHEAVAQGCARFAWEVLDWNDKAIRFYAALGADLKRDRVMTWLQGDALRRLAELI
jgi:GNAT superfamily N-acetyltransferase